MKKLFLLIIICAISFGAAIYLYQQHKQSELIASLRPMVKNASIRLGNSAKIDTQPSHITFKEIFDRLEADTSEIEKHDIEIQSMATKETAAFTDPVVAYLRDCQELSRALEQKYRKLLAANSAVEALKDSTSELSEAGTYDYEFARRRSDRAIKSATKASTEAKLSFSDAAAAAKKLLESRAKIAVFMPEDSLISAAQVQAVIRQNSVESEKIAKSQNTPAVWLCKDASGHRYQSSQNVPSDTCQLQEAAAIKTSE
jgi:hypothetical protein